MDLRECEEKSLELMRLHVPDWHFGFDRAIQRLGCTHYNNKTITLSSSFVSLNNWENVRLTVLHEIAHALVGFQHKHDWVWKKKCVEIGGNGKRTRDIDTVRVNLPYVAVCPVCHMEHFAARRPRRRKSCGACSNVFSEDRLLVYEKVKVCKDVKKKEEESGQMAFAW